MKINPAHGFTSGIAVVDEPESSIIEAWYSAKRTNQPPLWQLKTLLGYSATIDGVRTKARQSIAARLIVPFVGVSLLTTLLLGISHVYNMNSLVTDWLNKKSQIITHNLATDLSDPLTMGQTDRVQSIVDAAHVYDSDLAYATVYDTTGHVIVSTDAAVKGKVISPNAFQETLLKSKHSLRRDTGIPGVFEVAMPVMAEFGPNWIVLCGYSAERAREGIREAEYFTIAIGVFTLMLGISIYVSTISNDIIKPIGQVVEIANKISQGDLDELVEHNRKDEIGVLLQSMNHMILDLRRMASTADAVASGNLDVHIEPRSTHDVFGYALKEMVRGLRAYTTELAEREERFSTLCQTSPAGIFELDSLGMVYYSNECWQNICGRSAELLKGQPWYENVHPDDKDRVVASWWNQVDTDTHALWASEFRIVRPSGEIRWCFCLAKPLRSNRSGFAGNIEDITERRIQEEKSRRLALLEQREEFMATLTHDLKNPLIGANRVLELMADNYIEPISQRHSQLLLQIRDSNKRLLAMIQNLIEAYRCEQDVQIISIGEADIEQIITACVDEVSPIAKNRNVRIETSMELETPLWQVDGNAMSRVWHNLIDNALKFTSSGGLISIRVHQQGDRAVLSISDTGEGIAKDEQANLFQMFSQGKLGRKYTPGSGLGLYLCKQIIVAHNGSIKCNSMPGSGTTFEIEIPTAAFLPAPKNSSQNESKTLLDTIMTPAIKGMS